MTESFPYIAGVGRSTWSWSRSWLPATRTKDAASQLAISAGTKALLDAGISYDEVDLAISCGDISGHSDIFYVFGKTGIPIHGVEGCTGIYASIPFINQENKHCVLLLEVDQVGATGVVLVSEAFLWRHPYLKDAAAVIRSCVRRTPSKRATSTRLAVQEALRQAKLRLSDIQAVESNNASVLDDAGITCSMRQNQSNPSLYGICELVWLLRGWKSSAPSVQHCLHCVVTPNGAATVTMLVRADGKASPASEDAKYKNDGRERLGYNPVVQEKDIATEDWEAVRARAEFCDEKAADKVRFRRRGGDLAALAKL